jgi:hypothetical protein
MKKNTFCIAAAALILLSLQANLYSQNRGFHFLRNTIGARVASMAGAFVAIDKDIYAIVTNPAALASITEKQGTVDYVNSVLDIQSGFGAYVHPMTAGNIAFSIYYKDYGSFEKLDEFGSNIGSFSANSFVLTAAFARQYTKQIWYGGAVKYIQSGIESYSASGFAADLSFFYNSDIFDNLRIGGGIFNLGKATTAFIETKEELPTRLELGLSKELAHLPLRYSLAVQKYIEEDFRIAVGGEFKLSESLFFRLGYNTLGRDQKLGSDSDRFAGVSTGFGLVVKKYNIDYAYSSWGTVGSVNRFSFTFRF